MFDAILREICIIKSKIFLAIKIFGQQVGLMWTCLKLGYKSNWNFHTSYDYFVLVTMFPFNFGVNCLAKKLHLRHLKSY